MVRVHRSQYVVRVLLWVVALVAGMPRVAQAATCSTSASSMTNFAGATFDPQHLEGYFRVARIPGVLDVHMWRRPYLGGATATFKVAVKAGGDFIEVVWTASGTEVNVNGAPLAGESLQTPGGATVSRALLAVNVVLPGGAKVSVLRVPMAPSYLDFSVELPYALVVQASGACVGSQNRAPVPSSEYTVLPADLRVTAQALDRAPVGESIRYRVDVTNAGDFALNSLAFSAAPSWGPASTWRCTAQATAVCPAANGAGAPSGPLALPASGGLQFEVTAPVPEPLAAGSMVARVTPPAWTTPTDATVDEATLDWAHRFVDADGDGYGAEPGVFAAPAADLVEVGGDCDDQDASVFPGTPACCRSAMECDDGDACTQDTCSEGTCSHVASCVDAGAVDAGAVDAGVPDAGAQDVSPPPESGCGCRATALAGGGWWMALVAWSAALTRRRWRAGR